jgi:hypothetical protein
MEGMALIEPKLKSSTEETPEWVGKQAAKAEGAKAQPVGEHRTRPEENFTPPAPEDDTLPY